jgi:hypothetical protein
LNPRYDPHHTANATAAAAYLKTSIRNVLELIAEGRLPDLYTPEPGGDAPNRHNRKIPWPEVHALANEPRDSWNALLDATETQEIILRGLTEARENGISPENLRLLDKRFNKSRVIRQLNTLRKNGSVRYTGVSRSRLYYLTQYAPVPPAAPAPTPVTQPQHTPTPTTNALTALKKEMKALTDQVAALRVQIGELRDIWLPDTPAAESTAQPAA